MQINEFCTNIGIYQAYDLQEGNVVGVKVNINIKINILIGN